MTRNRNPFGKKQKQAIRIAKRHLQQYRAYRGVCLDMLKKEHEIDNVHDMADKLIFDSCHWYGPEFCELQVKPNAMSLKNFRRMVCR